MRYAPLNLVLQKHTRKQYTFFVHVLVLRCADNILSQAIAFSD
jgi:hypothetical protein